jgi:beta-lactamase superfamily II metal-dependent hydrolase
MRRFLAVLLVSLSVALLSAQARTTLDIYLVDVEGGNATLFVTPSGDSLLIDTGNGGAAAMRDADRILPPPRMRGSRRSIT